MRFSLQCGKILFNYSPQYLPVFRIRDVLTDPDPQIRTNGLQRIRILLFLSEAFKMPPKNQFFCLFRTVGTFTSVFKDNRLSGKQIIKKSPTVESKVFNFDGRIRICANTVITDPGGQEPTAQDPGPEHCSVPSNLSRYSVPVPYFRMQSVPQNFVLSW